MKIDFWLLKTKKNLFLITYMASPRAYFVFVMVLQLYTNNGAPQHPQYTREKIPSMHSFRFSAT